MNLPPDLLDFVNRDTWTFAKTYAPRWPHEYIVWERVDEWLFARLVVHIRAHGYLGRFYSIPITGRGNPAQFAAPVRRATLTL